MRRNLVVLWAIVVAVLCLPLSLAFGQGPGQQMYIAYLTDTPPVIDGVLGEEEYSGAIPLYVTFDDPTTPPGIVPWVEWDPHFPPPDNPDDLSFTIYAMYDEENLYIAVDVVDDIVFDDGPELLDDAVEIYIDGDEVGDDLQQGNAGKEGFKMIIDVGGDKVARDNGQVDWEVAPGLRPRGYVMEVRISLASIDTEDDGEEVPPSPGSSVGFNVAVDDDDNGGLWYNLLEWGPTAGAPLDEPAIDTFGAWDGSSPNWLHSREDDWGTLYFAPEIVRRLRESLVSATTTLGATRAGQPTPLEVTVALDAPLEATERMILDLSPLGIPSELPLHHAGEGRYTTSTTITPLRNGYYDLPVVVETEEEKRYFFLKATLDVYPGGDLSIYEDGPGAGWTIKASSRADSDPQSSLVVHSGSSAHAITLQLPDEKYPGYVTYTFEDADGVNLFGYTHLSFWIYPGEADIQKLFVEIVGERGKKKLDLVGDMGLELRGDRWIEVRIPPEDLGRIKSLKLSGKVTGTFYLDDMRLVAQEIEPVITAVEESGGVVLPAGYVLSQNYPNPFNPQTMIRYDLPEPGVVRLSVYNVVGQMVRMLVDGAHGAGYYSVLWDGLDSSGQAVASGVYLYRLDVEGVTVQTRWMVLLR